MALQPFAGLTAQPNANQVRALYAITNMQQAADAAELRVQDATDETFMNMREALNQSEANNRTLSERNAQLTNEISMLRQQIRELTSTSAVQRETQEAAVREERERRRALLRTADIEVQAITGYANKIKTEIQANIPQVRPLYSPTSFGYYMKHANETMEGMDNLLEHGEKIQSQISQINQ